MTFIALLDANVLINAAVRDTLLRAAEYDLYRLALSEDVLVEVQRNLEENLGRTREQTAYLLSEIRRSFQDAMVDGYDDLIPAMTNHEADRHVLAAAVRAGAEVIVTENVIHFPPAACEPYGIEAQRPGEFLTNLWSLSPAAMVRILYEQAADLRGCTVQQLADRLARDAPQFIDAIRRSGFLGAQ